MTKAATLAVLLILMASTGARSDPDCFVWRIAHERMVDKWRSAEPKCGFWTVGGETTCNSSKRSAARARRPENRID